MILDQAVRSQSFRSQSFRGQATREQDESYFISMTDMMVGLVFVLIVMLVYFALQYKQTTVELSDTKIRRTQLLERLKQRLAAEHLQVAVDSDAGVLRLPEDVLFDKGSSDVTLTGRAAMAKVGAAMQAELPCYTQAAPVPAGCPQTRSGLESVLIEGHSDGDPVAGGRDNWNLSTDRAVNIYRSLIASSPGLESMKNARLRAGEAQPILGVSGYGPTRPLTPEIDEDAKRRNRRIDIRFVMVTPTSQSG